MHDWCPAPGVSLNRQGLKVTNWVRSRSVSAGLAKRARMVLLAADGVGNREIARLVAASPTTVIAWRDRYEERGLRGLRDRERPGRPRELETGRSWPRR